MKKMVLIIISAFALSACSQLSRHNINVQQGNQFTQAQVKKLRPGMSKRQVAAIIGTPVYNNTFDKHRWTYVYTKRRRGGPRLTKRLVILFGDNGNLKRYHLS